MTDVPSRPRTARSRSGQPRTAQSLAAEAAFRRRLDGMGATLLEPEWLGTNRKHHVRCAFGHDCYLYPDWTMRGGGCRVCSRQDPAAAEADFRSRVEALGGVVLFDMWRGARRRHHVRCPAGHDCYPYPGNLKRGGGICRTCSGCDPATAEARFRKSVRSAGGTVLYERWQGVDRPHHVRCAAGHDCYPRPNDVRNKGGICRTCAGLDPAASEAAFRARLKELGATPLFDKWVGRQASYPVRCAAGHECSPRAGGVLSGKGICRTCATGAQTVFYVLRHESEPVVKFGISNHKGRKRLAEHRTAGFTIVDLLVTDLDDLVPRAAEKAVMAALALAGEKPVRGKEYFDASCLPLILDIASGWLGLREKSAASLAAVRAWVQAELFDA